MPSLGLQPQSAIGDDEIDIGDIARTLGRQWRKIAVVTVIITTLAIYAVLSARPVFTLNGAVYLGDTGASSDAAGALASSGLNFLTDFQSVSDVDTQVALLQSTSLLEQAILETGLNASIVPEGRPVLRFWRWRYIYGESVDAFAPQPGDLQVLDATLDDPGSGGAGYELVFDGNGNYHLQIPGGLFSDPYTVLKGTLGQPTSGAGIAFVIKSAIDGAVPPTGSKYILSISPAKSLAAYLPIGPLVIAAGGKASTQANIATIQFSWSDPYKGQQFVNQLMNDYIATQLAWKTESASATESFVSGQLEKISASLAAANKDLAAYQAKTGIIDVSGNGNAVISQLSDYEVQQSTVQLQQEALQQLQKSLSQTGAGLNPYLVSQAGDSSLAALGTTLVSDEAALQAARVQFTGNAPEIQAQEASITKIQESIRTIIANDEAFAGRSLANLQAMIAKYQAKIKSMPAESLQVLTLTQSSQVFGQLYVLLMEKEEEAEVSKAATIVETRVISPSEVPLNATKPKAAFTVLAGLVLGLFAGLALVLAQRAISGSFQSDDDIRRAVPLPVYGMIPRLSRIEIARGILSDRPQSPFSEAFRLLRSNLYQSASGRQSKVILVTSASSADGKTTTSANLAKILADDGKRVVLVDGDLHRGRVHEVLKLNQAPGLTEWLVTTDPSRLQPVDGQRFVVLPTRDFSA